MTVFLLLAALISVLQLGLQPADNETGQTSSGSVTSAHVCADWLEAHGPD